MNGWTRMVDGKPRGHLERKPRGETLRGNLEGKNWRREEQEGGKVEGEFH